MTGHLIDTHCHLDFPVFDGCRTRLLARARAAGVDQIVVPGVVADDWPRLLACCEEHGLLPALGLHPCFLSRHRDGDLDTLAQGLAQYPVVAVGEIGLDFFIPDPEPERQLKLFDAQLELAQRFNLPVLLHVRKAHDQVLALLRRYRLARGGLVHAYSGSLQQAEQYLQLGFRLGIGGTLSYSRAKRLREIVTALPLESFVLETDAPDIPLADYRDEPNRPERVAEVAAILAQLRGVSAECVADLTGRTARDLLALKA
jgi:TatD DNase family protein